MGLRKGPTARSGPGYVSTAVSDQRERARSTASRGWSSGRGLPGINDTNDSPTVPDSDRAAVPVRNADVLLMPEGATRETLDEHRNEVAEIAMEYGYQYTPRLHVDLWNDAPGI